MSTTEDEKPFSAEELHDLEERCDFEVWAAFELKGPHSAKVYNPRRLFAAAKRDAERTCFVAVDPDVIVGKPKVGDRALSKEEIKAESAPAADLYKRFNSERAKKRTDFVAVFEDGTSLLLNPARTRELAEQMLAGHPNASKATIEEQPREPTQPEQIEDLRKRLAEAEADAKVQSDSSRFNFERAERLEKQLDKAIAMVDTHDQVSAKTIESLRAERDAALAAQKQAEAEYADLLEPDYSDHDKPIPEDEAIKAAHPIRTGKHAVYVRALEMVSAKHSKGALVEMVNWLLVEIEKHDEVSAKAIESLRAERDAALCFEVTPLQYEQAVYAIAKAWDGPERWERYVGAVLVALRGKGGA